MSTSIASPLSCSLSVEEGLEDWLEGGGSMVLSHAGTIRDGSRVGSGSRGVIAGLRVAPERNLEWVGWSGGGQDIIRAIRTHRWWNWKSEVSLVDEWNVRGVFKVGGLEMPVTQP
jgi:hypothetical protein